MYTCSNCGTQNLFEDSYFAHPEPFCIHCVQVTKEKIEEKLGKITLQVYLILLDFFAEKELFKYLDCQGLKTEKKESKDVIIFTAKDEDSRFFDCVNSFVLDKETASFCTI